jgi:hypothetical protein
LVKQFQKRSARVQKDLEKKVESAVHDALKHLEPASLHRKSAKAKGKRAASARRSAKRAGKR